MDKTDDAPRDTLGRRTRRLRYPVRVHTKISETAEAELQAMAEATGMKPAKLIRRALMKDIHIWKAKQARKEQ